MKGAGRVPLVLPFQVNPFTSAAFGSPWSEVPTDVQGINDEPFRMVLRALRQMRAGDRGTSIVITGEPGSGKTHLLGRLRNRLELDEREGKGQTVYVYVRCNASASTLWRHLQHAIASDLLKPMAGGRSRLDTILHEHPERLATVENLHLRRALEAIRDGQRFHLASAWLRGEMLSDGDLEAIGIAVEKDDEDRSREADATRLAVALLRFTAPTPSVLCFDQVEALETYRGEEAGFHAMGQMVSALNDSLDHLLMISCVVNDYEHVFEKLPNKADQDRWLQAKATLRPIDWANGVELVKARLDSSATLGPMRKAHPADPLWPIDAASLRPLFSATGLCLPRTLIQTCKRLFDHLLGDDEPLPKMSREAFLQHEYAARLRQAREAVLRQGADKTLDESLPWLLETSRLAPLPPDPRRSRYANRAFRGGGGNTAVSSCFQTGVALTNRFKRINREWKPNADRLILLRNPATKIGAVGAGVLARLKADGAKEIYPLPEALAALKAIQDLRATAVSGELYHDAMPVSEREVTAWALENLPPELEELRAELASDMPPVDEASLSKLSELVHERKIIAIEAAARELSLAIEEVDALARRHPLRFGVLLGPPVVVFEAIEGPAAESAGA